MHENRKVSPIKAVARLFLAILFFAILPLTASLFLAQVNPILPFLIIVPSFIVSFGLWFFLNHLGESRARQSKRDVFLRNALPFLPFILALFGGFIGSALSS